MLKEKAIELRNKFRDVRWDIDPDTSKQCALIAVNNQINYIENEMIGIDYTIRKIFIDELIELKTEIEKL
jgi:hypothetical protein